MHPDLHYPHSKYRNNSKYTIYILYKVEQKKTQRADLDSKRLTGFLAGLIVSLSLFLAAMQYTTSDDMGRAETDLSNDIMRDADLMPAPDRRDMIAAVEPQRKKAATQAVKVVDQKRQMEKLNNITQMRTVGESGGAAGEGGKGDSRNADDAETLQPVAVDNNDNPLNFRVVEQLPEFPGGMSAFVKWLTDNLRYPPYARQRNVQGRVVITFIINRDGTTSDIKVAKSADPLLDREALRVARMMPRWRPGLNGGKPCRTMFAIPIEFRI